MQMRPQKIALALCVTVVATFIVLWVRSNLRGDLWRLNFASDRAVHVESKVGQFELAIWPLDHKSNRAVVEWHSGFVAGDPCRLAKNWIGVDSYCHNGFVGLVVPHWSIVFSSAALGGLIWIRETDGFRFSLRALFIAMTLVAVLLGLILM